MVDIRVTFNDHGLADAFKRKAGQMNAEFNKLTMDLTDIAKRWVKDTAPRGKTGKLKASVQSRSFGSRGIVWLSKSIAPYCYFVTDGTRPHDIKPKNGKALFWPGASHPSKVVHHPGTKSNPFVDKAFGNMQGEIDGRIKVFEKWLEV